jgi:GNAT superfamily N-acetyltransferase
MRPRWAKPGDAEYLAEFLVTSWQMAYEGILAKVFLAGLDRASRAAWWRRFVEGGGRVHVVGRPGVGFCHVGGSDDPDWGEVFAIYVHPDRWGEGLGHDLFLAGEQTLREYGHDRALLWVLEGNDRGIRFYERHGWKAGKPIRLEDIGGVQVTELRYEVEW